MMSFGLWSVLIAGLLPLAWVGFAKITGGRYDNNAPRDFLAGTTGAARRGVWAEQNAHEALPLYAAGMIIAHYLKGPSDQLDLIALVFVIARIAHGLCYLLDYALLRTLCWLVAWIATISLFVVAAG